MEKEGVKETRGETKVVRVFGVFCNDISYWREGGYVLCGWMWVDVGGCGWMWVCGMCENV